MSGVIPVGNYHRGASSKETIMQLKNIITPGKICKIHLDLSSKLPQLYRNNLAENSTHYIYFETKEDELFLPMTVLNIKRLKKLIDKFEKEYRPSNIIDIRKVFDYWVLKMNKPKAKFTTGRRLKISSRLKDGYEVLDILQAIDNCSKTPHNMGKNANNTEYNDINLICRSGDKLEYFRDQCNRNFNKKVFDQEISNWLISSDHAHGETFENE